LKVFSLDRSLGFLCLQDIRLIEEGVQDPRLEMAIVVRLGEKRVLEELQAWFEAHLARVPTLEFYAERRLRDLGLLDDKGFMTPWV
jgi:[ribulose-bisphosphate carboxylase]-lysine N-methyltransferase